MLEGGTGATSAIQDNNAEVQELVNKVNFFNCKS